METVREKRLKKSVRIRLVKEMEEDWKYTNQGKWGQVKSSLRNIPTAPRKMRLVADMIRGKSVSVAFNILKFDNKHASSTLEKILLTAVADWQAANENVKIEEADLYVKEISVDSARILKRMRPAPQGRAHRIRKRSHHVSVVIDDRNIDEDSVQTEEEITR